MTGTDIADPGLDQARHRSIRRAGIVLACSTPISGLISFALVSILVGESRLEGPAGFTAAGWVAVGLPLLLGAALVLWSFWNPWSPSRTTTAALAALAAAVFLGTGLWSTNSSEAGDASIGGGLLVLASIPIGIGAILLFRSARARR